MIAARALTLLFLAAVCGFTYNVAAQPEFAAAGGSTLIQGDGDCNGTVAVPDLGVVLRAAADVPAGSGCINQTGNLNCTGGVDIEDVLRLARHLAGVPMSAAGGCAAIGSELSGGQPTSADLIEAALEKGDIDEGTAAYLKILAAYDDPALPSEYDGFDEQFPVSYNVAQGSPLYASMSAQEQSQVDPYLLPPIAPGSWFEAQGGASVQPQSGIFSSISIAVSGTNGIKLWTPPSVGAPTRDALGEVLKQVLEKAFVTFGQAPLSDLLSPNNGGDGALDVYVVPGPGTDAIVKWHRPPDTCNETPGYIEISLTAVPDVGAGASSQPSSFIPTSFLSRVVPPVSHGIAGIIAGAFKPLSGCILTPNYQWLLEATSALIEHEAYPTLNTEHKWDEVFESAHETLHEFEEGGHSLWTLLEHFERSDASAVSSIWSRIGTSLTGVLAMAGAVNLQEMIPSFSLELWNESPHNFFESAHQILGSVSSLLAQGTASGESTPVTLDGQEEVELNASIPQVDDFSAQHYHFKISDPAVKSLSINNLLGGSQTSVMQVLYKIVGGSDVWESLSMASQSAKTFCLTNPEQNISEFVVVLTHFDATETTPAQLDTDPLVQARDDCPWSGNAKVTASLTFQGQEYLITGTATDVVFAESTDNHFVPTSGTLVWDFFYSSPNCEYTGRKTVPLDSSFGEMEIIDNGGDISYTMYGYKNVTVPLDFSCVAGSPNSQTSMGTWLCSGDTRTSSDKTHISGTYDDVHNNGFGGPYCPPLHGPPQNDQPGWILVVYEWDFSRSPE